MKTRASSVGKTVVLRASVESVAVKPTPSKTNPNKGARKSQAESASQKHVANPALDSKKDDMPKQAVTPSKAKGLKQQPSETKEDVARNGAKTPSKSRDTPVKKTPRKKEQAQEAQQGKESSSEEEPLGGRVVEGRASTKDASKETSEDTTKEASKDTTKDNASQDVHQGTEGQKSTSVVLDDLKAAGGELDGQKKDAAADDQQGEKKRRKRRPAEEIEAEKKEKAERKRIREEKRHEREGKNQKGNETIDHAQANGTSTDTTAQGHELAQGNEEQTQVAEQHSGPGEEPHHNERDSSKAAPVVAVSSTSDQKEDESAAQTKDQHNPSPQGKDRPIASPRPSSKKILSPEEVVAIPSSKIRKEWQNDFCKICCLSAHPSSECTVINGGIAAVSKRYEELKSLRASKNQLERAAQGELKQWLDTHSEHESKSSQGSASAPKGEGARKPVAEQSESNGTSGSGQQGNNPVSHMKQNKSQGLSNGGSKNQDSVQAATESASEQDELDASRFSSPPASATKPGRQRSSSEEELATSPMLEAAHSQQTDHTLPTSPSLLPTTSLPPSATKADDHTSHASSDTSDDSDPSSDSEGSNNDAESTSDVDGEGNTPAQEDDPIEDSSSSSSDEEEDEIQATQSTENEPSQSATDAGHASGLGWLTSKLGLGQSQSAQPSPSQSSPHASSQPLPRTPRLNGGVKRLSELDRKRIYVAKPASQANTPNTPRQQFQENHSSDDASSSSSDTDSDNERVPPSSAPSALPAHKRAGQPLQKNKSRRSTLAAMGPRD